MHQALNKQQAADKIDVSLRTLNRMMHDRREGDVAACPDWFVLRGRVFFESDAVDAWLQDIRTSEVL